MSGQRMLEKKAKRAAKTGKNGKSRKQVNWRKADENTALSFKQQGYEVKCIGLKEWVVAI